ncbi:MAG: hypothetical protein JXR31_14525 [Prolixibacteraceae bacterium]|nr:hypothetical protein [Prolixibacteraceae bacterium]MBN2775467.1 hypothetical protein [Prolixibacteraceae bacterium]
MKFITVNQFLKLTVLLLIVLGLSTCSTSRKSSSTANMFKIPKKIINAEDLPSSLRTESKGQVHYVQLFPDEITKDDIIPVEQTEPENIVSEVQEKADEGEKTEPDAIDAYVEEIVDNLVHSRSRPTFYHIVSGSFQNKLYADMFAEHLKNIGYGNTYVQFFDNGFNRVIVQRYNNEVEARQYLQGYRGDNPLYADAWLYYKLSLENDPMAYITR